MSKIDLLIRDLGFALAILHGRREAVLADRQNYRMANGRHNSKRYGRALEAIAHAEDQLRKRWERLSSIAAAWLNPLMDETPSAVAKRIRKAQARHREASASHPLKRNIRGENLMKKYGADIARGKTLQKHFGGGK